MVSMKKTVRPPTQALLNSFSPAVIFLISCWVWGLLQSTWRTIVLRLAGHGEHVVDCEASHPGPQPVVQGQQEGRDHHHGREAARSSLISVFQVLWAGWVTGTGADGWLTGRHGFRSSRKADTTSTTAKLHGQRGLWVA